ncbi:MAG: FAD-dependent oxidoreductase [Acidithiobacillus sp.]
MSLSFVTLSPDLLEARFRPLEAVLPAAAALTEAARCYYCYDAPCVAACPTDIDIPGFIRAIAMEQPTRAAERILQANPLGGSCARVCPVETLCEQSCVRQSEEGGPVRIGLLQHLSMVQASPDLFPAAKALAPTQKIAVVGAGPAGLTAAHLLALAGFAVELFEARALAGGLNESGIAVYKMLDDAAQQEVAQLLSGDRIHLRCGMALGHDITLAQLRNDYAAVFLALGLQGQNRLNVPGEDLAGVFPAVPFIAQMRQGKSVPVGQKIVVIGGGMTAIDIAIQIRLLGAEEVHLCYRRGPDAMGASAKEQQLARDQGVLIHHYLRPLQIEGVGGHCAAIWLQPTVLQDEVCIDHGEPLRWLVDQVFTAIGQRFHPGACGEDGAFLQLDMRGKIAVDTDFHTNLPGVWAGGDCVGRSEDLTVYAVADAKQAVQSMLAMLRADTLGSGEHRHEA